MSRVITHRPNLTISQEPEVTREKLVEEFLKDKYLYLSLVGICDGFAHFGTSMKYYMTKQKGARYNITCKIPLTDPMLNTGRIVNVVFPSKVKDLVQFDFDCYVNKDGMTIGY